MSSPERATQIVQSLAVATGVSSLRTTQIVQTIVVATPLSALRGTQIVEVVSAVAVDISGVYYINLHKIDGLHDSYNGGIEKKIPNPIIRTALLGE